jgi:hypothetical protein
VANNYIRGRDRSRGTLWVLHPQQQDGRDLTALTTLMLTLYIKGGTYPGNVINGRNKQDVLGGGSGQKNVTMGLDETNPLYPGVGTAAAPGRVVWNIQPADNALAGDADETHVGLFEWTGPNENDHHEVEIVVPNTRVRPE